MEDLLEYYLQRAANTQVRLGLRKGCLAGPCQSCAAPRASFSPQYRAFYALRSELPSAYLR